MLHATHLLTTGYFPAKNKMIVNNIVEVMEHYI